MSGAGTASALQAKQSSQGLTRAPADAAEQSSSAVQREHPDIHRTSSVAGAAADPASSSTGKVPADATAHWSSGSGSCQPQSISVNQTPEQIQCALCKENISLELFTEHLSDFHAEQCCEHCGKKVKGAVGLLHHIEEGHEDPPHQTSVSQPHQLPEFKPQHGKPAIPPQQPPPQPQQCIPPVQRLQPIPPAASSPVVHLRPPEVNWVSFLPKQFMRVIKPADQEWIAQCLYKPTGQFRQQFSQNWFHPPTPPKVMTAPPDPLVYFRQRMFLWAPMRMWGIPLKCQQCNKKMHHSGIYPKVREVLDIDSRYYLIGGDYPRCSKCMIPVCPWSSEVLSQLDPAHRNKFPAILTTQLALDKRCVTLLKPRTIGNSSSYVQQALEELHSEEWAKCSIEYLSDCELHKKKSVLARSPEVVYQNPPQFCPLPLAQWFETVHANEILSHLSEMKGVITSTYGKILKLDSTKKV